MQWNEFVSKIQNRIQHLNKLSHSHAHTHSHKEGKMEMYVMRPKYADFRPNPTYVKKDKMLHVKMILFYGRRRRRKSSKKHTHIYFAYFRVAVLSLSVAA